MFTNIPLIVYVISIPLQIVSSNKTCDDNKRELADAQSAFVNCATHNSIPVNLCQKCAIEYYSMTNHYENVTKCTKFFDQDRLNVILTVQEAIVGLWSKAFCNDCYVDHHNVTFSKMYKAYEDCVTMHKNTNNTCSNCTAVYKALNDYFITLNKKNDGKVCFDFQDQMNRTRHYWSKTLNCCQREKHLIIFASVAIITISIVGTFYLATFGLIKYKERNYEVLSDEGMTTPTRIMATPSNIAESTSNSTTDSVTTLRLNNTIVTRDNDDSSDDEEISDKNTSTTKQWRDL